MFKGRNPHLPGDYLVINGHIAPPSYCDIRLGMAMFRDAHHYFGMVSKDVEAYEEIAKDLDDGEFLTDTELFTEICQVSLWCQQPQGVEPSSENRFGETTPL